MRQQPLDDHAFSTQNPEPLYETDKQTSSLLRMAFVIVQYLLSCISSNSQPHMKTTVINEQLLILNICNILNLKRTSTRHLIILVNKSKR